MSRDTVTCALHVLGPVELTIAGESVPVRRGRPRRLLLALVMAEGHVASVDALVDAVWEDGNLPANPANALQVLISYLRRTLEPTPLRIDTVATGYRLAAPRDQVDAFVLADRVRALDGRSDPTLRLAVAEEALAAWHGDPYADVAFSAFAQPAIHRLRELQLRALAARTQALLDLGRVDRALGDLQALAAEHPLHEHFHAQRIIALYRSGRQAEALRAYDAARAALVDGLGVEPGPELQAALQAVLHHAVVAVGPPPAPGVHRPGPQRPRCRRRPAAA